MKIYIILSLAIPCLFFSNLVLGQTFSSEKEIDAYYDAQLYKIEQESTQKIQAINEQLQRDIDNISKETEAEKWAAYKRIFGEDFEMVKPFLPESNPDPLYHANNLLLLSRIAALNALKNIKVINPDLAGKVEIIYEREYSKINQQVSNSKNPPPAINVFNELDKMPDTLKSASIFSTIKEKDFSMYAQIQVLASTKYFNDQTTPTGLSNYIKSLSTVEANIVRNKLAIFNPGLLNEINILEKNNITKNKPVSQIVKPEAVKENPKPLNSRSVLENIPDKDVEVLNKEQALIYYNKVKQLKFEGKTSEAQSIIDEMSEGDYKVFESLVNELKATTTEETKSVEVKKNFVQRIFGFFKRLAFWR